MYLKDIYMENFKSFGKRMEIPIREGYTNITGPNGSGKSNIADAILFVLGPKSSKEIRAGRLTDLLFNGGKEGKPADYCRVSLTFQNKDKTIPMNEEEVTFTRKVQRSDNNIGYNSYFYINGRSSSLTEFQELLSHARITSDGYNMVQQGDISKIVEMSDLERRRILDQISGITRYDKEIEKAEKSKQEVINDLERINILLDEIGKQVRELEADTKEALKYQELSDKVNEAKNMKAWKTKEGVEQEIDTIRKDIEENKGQCEEIGKKKVELKEKVKQLKEDLIDIDNELAKRGSKKNKELQEKVSELRLELARAEDSVEDAEHDINESKAMHEEYKKEIENKTKELATITEELTAAKEEEEKVKAQIEAVTQEIAEIKSEQASSDERIIEMQKKGMVVSKELESKVDKLSKKKVELDRQRDSIARMNEKLAEDEEDLEALQLDKKDNEWVLKDAKKSVSHRDKNLNKLKEAFHEYKKKEKRLRRDKSDLEERLNRLDREYHHLKAQDAAAKSLKKGYNRAVETVLQARDTGKIKGIHGTVAELADVSKEYETALQVAAGGRMQSIVVEHDGVASDAINLLKKKEAGRATFLPINKMLPGRPGGKAIRTKNNDKSLGFALDLVDYDDKYENVFWYVFQDTVVMEDIDSARSLMGGVRMVTMGGESIERSGAMIGGNLSKNMLSFQAPDRGKLERVGKELTKTRENLEKVTEELKTVDAELQNTQSEIMEAQSEGVRTDKITKLKSEIKRLTEKITKKEKQIKDKHKEISDAREDLEKLEKSVDFIEENIEELKLKRKEISDMIKDISPKELSTRLGELRDKEIQLNKRFNEIASEIKVNGEKKTHLQNSIKEYKGEISKLKNNISNLESKIKKKKIFIKDRSKEEDELRKRLSSMDSELEGLRKERDQKFEKKLSAEKEIERFESLIEGKKLYIKSQEEKIVQHTENLKEIQEELEEDIDFSGKKMPSMKELKNIIHRGQEKMERLGPINMRAVQDYEGKKERKETLQEEYTQLSERREGLDELINKLDEKKKVGLIKVKNEINDNFVEVYKELSGGGDANIELENPEAPFEGGLIIKARPPGKKVHRIQALSGGEKSLVSMAFIFAIQRYDPSPFYLLDEVDQNLDGVNAEKVADMIKSNSESAQFIQVSLRKITLKKSDHIIGVTINKKGISDVIMKVDLGRNEEADIPELSGISQLEAEV